MLTSICADYDVLFVEDGPATRGRTSCATPLATPHPTDSAAPDGTTVPTKTAKTCRNRSSIPQASAATPYDAVDAPPEVNSVNAVATFDELSNQAQTSETAPVVTVKTPKAQKGKKRSRVDIEQEDIDGNAVADQEREALEPRRTRSGAIVDAAVLSKSPIFTSRCVVKA